MAAIANQIEFLHATLDDLQNHLRMIEHDDIDVQSDIYQTVCQDIADVRKQIEIELAYQQHEVGQ